MSDLPAWLLETRPDLAESQSYAMATSGASAGGGGGGGYEVPAGFSGTAGLNSGEGGEPTGSSLNRNTGGINNNNPAVVNSEIGQTRVPPGPRTFGLVDPPRRAVYRMMVRQLLSDGFADAAMAIVRSTGVVVANPGTEPQRLLQLVQSGATAERLVGNNTSGSSASSGVVTNSATARGMIEDCIYSADPYSLFQQPSPAAFDYREWYTSKNLDRPLRCARFNTGGDIVIIGTASGDVRLYSVQLADEYAQSASAGDLQNPTDAAVVRAMPALHPGHSVEAVGLHPQHPIAVSGGRDGRLVFTKYSTQFGAAASTGAGGSTMGTSAETTADGSLTASNLLSHKTVAAHHDSFAIRAVDMHPAGDVVLFGTDHYVPRMYHIETGHVYAPASSAEQHTQSAVGGEGGAGGTADPFMGGQRGSRQANDGAQASIRFLRDNDPSAVHLGSITDVAYSADGRCFATSSFDGNVRFFDGRTGGDAAVLLSAHCGVAATSVKLSRSGYIALTAGLDSQVRLWDLRKPVGGNEVASFCTTGGAPVKQKVQSRARAVFTSDERGIIATNSDLTGILHIDAATMKPSTAINYWGGSTGGASSSSSAAAQAASSAGSASGVIRTVVASPTRSLLAAGGDDMRLRLWAPLITTRRDQ